MENKQDWEELRKWEESKKQSNIETYKIDINEIEELQNRRKKMDKILNPVNQTLVKVKKVLIILAAIIGILAFIIFVGYLASVRNFVNADIYSMLNFYGVEVQIISQEADQKGNGKYLVNPEGYPEIQFTAKKRWGNIQTDFKDNYQKYLFTHWESDRKEKFSTNEELEDGLLVYQNYIIVNENETIEEATEDFISFIAYAENWNSEHKIINMPHWPKEYFRVPLNIYIYLQEEDVWLKNIYTGTGQTEDKMRETIKSELENAKLETR